MLCVSSRFNDGGRLTYLTSFFATSHYVRLVERGGSAVIGPNSHYIVQPVFNREELIVADLDFIEIDREVMTLDVSGHYARPDLFRFERIHTDPK